MNYNNFKDPVGLALRMIRSGNRAAHFTLFREGLDLALQPLDWCLSFWEKRYVAKAPKVQLPMMLILGGSRSGTTLLYQTLAQYLPVSYFTNLGSGFPRSTLVSTKLFSRFMRKKKVKTFENYYGSIAGFGAPNDGFHLWNNWLGEDRNAVPEKISPEVKKQIRTFFEQWHATFKQPMLNKNNRNSLCVPVFYECVPNVYFLEIRRNPVFVVQSLIRARQEIQGTKAIGWGLRSHNSDLSEDPLRYIDDICAQVYEVECILDEAKTQVPTDRYLQFKYEDFCANPAGVVQMVSKMVFGRELPQTELKDLLPFKESSTRHVSDEEYERIIHCLNRLYPSPVADPFRKYVSG